MLVAILGYVPVGTLWCVLERPLNIQCIRNTYLEGSMNRSWSDTGDDDDCWGFKDRQQSIGVNLQCAL